MSYVIANDLQKANEDYYCKHNIDKRIKQVIQKDTGIQSLIDQGAVMLEEWRNTTFSYASKNARVAQLHGIDLRDITEKVFIQTAYYRAAVTFVNVVAQLTRHLGFSDKKDGITTMAEILAVLAQTDAYDITKASAQAQLMFLSRIKLPNNIEAAIDRGMFPPPMVSEPEDLKNNHESPYLTFNEHLILGKGDKHEGNIALDVINTQNKVPLKLNVEFLKSVEESPNKPFENIEQKNEWSFFKKQSYHIYWRMVKQGNHFYLTHKVDKRLRLYSQGYHINYQGTAFKKACLELVHEEIIDGVPTN
jgi:hypothetical protein